MCLHSKSEHYIAQILKMKCYFKKQCVSSTHKHINSLSHTKNKTQSSTSQNVTVLENFPVLHDLSASYGST